jgi:hypothetical protein
VSRAGGISRSGWKELRRFLTKILLGHEPLESVRLQVCSPTTFSRGALVFLPAAPQRGPRSPSSAQSADVRLASSKMAGATRRAFPAEMMFVARLCRQRPLGGSRVRLGTPYPGAWPRGTTPGGHVSRSPVCVQWTETWGRHAASGSPRALSTRRSACATRPDLSHAFGLYAADGRRGVGRAQRAGLSSGPTARAAYEGHGAHSPRLPPAHSGQS